MVMPSPNAALLVLAIALLAVAGCGDRTRTVRAGNYRTVQAEPDRDTDAAKRYNQRGLEHLAAGDLNEAAMDFRRALAADVQYGPAHNNLGKVYYAEKDWYQAAWEFEYARELMPRHPEPLNNLGLVHEQAGEFDRAIEHYDKAVALDPDNIEYRANLARAMVRRGDRTEQLKLLLQQILAEDTRPDWLVWAKAHLAHLRSRGL